MFPAKAKNFRALFRERKPCVSKPGQRAMKCNSLLMLEKCVISNKTTHFNFKTDSYPQFCITTVVKCCVGVVKNTSLELMPSNAQSRLAILKEGVS